MDGTTDIRYLTSGNQISDIVVTSVTRRGGSWL
jgi:hypothetical protein